MKTQEGKRPQREKMLSRFKKGDKKQTKIQTYTHERLTRWA